MNTNWRKTEVRRGKLVHEIPSFMSRETAMLNRTTFAEGKFGWALLIDLRDLIIGYHEDDDDYWIQWKEGL